MRPLLFSGETKMTLNCCHLNLVALHTGFTATFDCSGSFCSGSFCFRITLLGIVQLGIILLGIVLPGIRFDEGHNRHAQIGLKSQVEVSARLKNERINRKQAKEKLSKKQWSEARRSVGVLIPKRTMIPSFNQRYEPMQWYETKGCSNFMKRCPKQSAVAGQLSDWAISSRSECLLHIRLPNSKAPENGG
jgi:hypothetical protein